MRQLLCMELMRVVVTLCIVWIGTAPHSRMSLISSIMWRAIDAVLHLGLHASARRCLSVAGHRIIGKSDGHHARCHHCLQTRQHKQCENTVAKAAIATKVAQDCHDDRELSIAILNRDSDSLLIRYIFSNIV